MKKILIGLVMVSFMFSLVPMVSAQPTDTVIDGNPYRDISDETNVTQLSVQQIVQNAVNWFAGITALISVIVIVIAGIMWATSQGDEDKVKTARQWVIAGVVGALIALAAWSITEVVIQGFLQDTTM